MTDKEIQETVARLKAYAECFKKKMGRTSMMECFENLCDGCTLLYAQGTVAEHLKDIETAIRVLDAVSRQQLMYMDNSECITRSVNHVVDDIRSIPSVKLLDNQRQWIPVSERLPEDGERVLVTYDKIVIRATWDLMRYSFYDTHAVSLDKDFVYAWMPLPEPYKESEEKNDEL